MLAKKRRNKRSWILVGIILVALIVVVYVKTPTKTGTQAPDFTLTDINGKTISLSALKGKPVILDFMATWCSPCREEVIHLRSVYSKYGASISIISVSVDPTSDTAQKLQQFAADQGISWSIVLDTANVNQKYEVTAIPAVVIVDKDGFIRFKYEGIVAKESLYIEIDKLLGGQ